VRVVIASVISKWYFYSEDEKEMEEGLDKSDDDNSDDGFPTTRLLSSASERQERGLMTDSALTRSNDITMLSIVESAESVGYKNMGSVLFAAAVLSFLEGFI
jgi:hypothetical protein